MPAGADHDWDGLHWGRTANPLSLQLGDDVTLQWDAALRDASADWNVSKVLDTAVVAGAANPKGCPATAGRVEVCNSRYGANGWLGLATIWAGADKHITQATVPASPLSRRTNWFCRLASTSPRGRRGRRG